MTNKEFLKDKAFLECCKKANIEPSKRQASKFRNKKGIAYKYHEEVKDA